MNNPTAGEPRPTLWHLQVLGAKLAMHASARSPVAATVWSGIEVERRSRAALEWYREFLAKTAGLASREEVLSLRELVRALEYRLERLEGAGGRKARKRSASDDA